jgi:endonuclease/exonuclease/phosphatase (EEP) superfamily protein YafD
VRWQTVAFRLLLAGPLVPAVGLTLLRLLEPQPGVLVRLTSFVPLALPLYVLAFALVLGKLVFPGRESMRPWLAVMVLVLVGTGLHAWWLRPEFTGSRPDPAHGAQKLQVMTMNLFKGAADPATVVRTAALERIDILVLEEITPSTLRKLEQFGLSEAFPYRAGVPQDGAKGTMAFATYRISGAERINTTLGAWSFDVVLPQGMLRMYAVHVRPPFGGARDWRDDLALIRKTAEKDRGLDLIAGDFNATPDHKPFRDLIDLDLRSAAERTNAGWQTTWPDHGEKSFLGIPLPRLIQIDHVLVGRSMTATKTETFSIKGADHRAVVAEVANR